MISPRLIWHDASTLKSKPPLHEGECSTKPRSGLYEIILQSFEIMGRSLAQLESKSANQLIKPKTDSFDSSDFSARKEMIEAGYLAGQQAVPALRTLLNLKT